MSSKQDLLQRLDAAYGEFRSTVEDLDEHSFEIKWMDGRWGVREMVAHLTGWHGKLASALERMSRGEKPVPDGEDWTDPQPFNNVFAQHAKGKTKAEILAELDAAVATFKKAAAKVPEERFGDGKTANRIFDGAGISHFQEHTGMVRAWRRE